MKQISTSNNNLTMAQNRKPLGGWKIASIIHCMLFAWQQGLLFTYVFGLVFGIVEHLTAKSFPSISALSTFFKTAPYCLYGSFFCLLCLHLNKSHLKEDRSILWMTALLAFAHQAMLINSFMVIFYVACILGTILPLLNYGAFKKTALFDWPLCKKQAKYPFNIGVLFVTMIVSIGICAVLSIPEAFHIPILSIIAVLFKMEFLENFTEYYDLAYSEIGKTLGKIK